MGSLDVDSLFTNIPVDETIDICVNQFFENTDTSLLVLPYLGIISLQTRTKALKSDLNCCKLKIVFKCQTRLSHSFRYKDPIPKDLISGVI